MPTQHTGSSKVSPKRLGRLASALVKNPLWATIGSLVGVIGVVVSGVQIYQAAQDAPADLEVAMSTIGGPQSVPAVGIDLVSSTRILDSPVHDVKYNPIDITLKNNGGEPSLVTRVVVDVKIHESLNDCTFSGAGPAGISAEYSLKIPAGNGPPYLGEVPHDVRFEVKPGAVDRMALTIGPEVETSAYYPYVMGFAVRLIQDDGSELEAGSFATVGNLKGVNENLALGPTPSSDSRTECAKKNLDTLEKLMEFQSVKSDELLTLREKYMEWAT